MKFAIPWISGSSDLTPVMVRECSRSILDSNPGSIVVIISDDPSLNANGLDVVQCSHCDLPVSDVRFKADWVKAQAFRTIQEPVWVIDADIVVLREFPFPTSPTVLPYHYPLIPASVFGFPGEFCTTIACWFQGVDIFPEFKKSFADLFNDRLGGERSGLAATLSVGGSVTQDPFVVTPVHPNDSKDIRDRLSAQPENPHAIHYAGNLKYWHYSE